MEADNQNGSELRLKVGDSCGANRAWARTPQAGEGKALLPPIALARKTRPSAAGRDALFRTSDFSRARNLAPGHHHAALRDRGDAGELGGRSRAAEHKATGGCQ